jgi:hypothetical protein
MSLPAKVLIPFVAGLLIAGAAQAQLLPTWETSITLTQQDLDMIRNTVTNQIHGKPVGTTASWSNPASGNSGFIKLGKKLARKNSNARKSNIRCARAARRSTPSTIISSAVYSRTEPGKSRELRCSGALRMDPALKQEIVSILNEANDLTIATVREDGYPQATTVSYVNAGLTIYFGCAAESQKAKNIARSDKVSLTVNLPYASRDEIRGLSIGARLRLSPIGRRGTGWGS